MPFPFVIAQRRYLEFLETENERLRKQNDHLYQYAFTVNGIAAPIGIMSDREPQAPTFTRTPNRTRLAMLEYAERSTVTSGVDPS